MSQQMAEAWGPLAGLDHSTDRHIRRAKTLGVSLVAGSTGFEAAPLIMPWPYATDGNDQTYPPDIVALLYGLPDPDQWDGDWEAYCDLHNPEIIAIPKSLPSGFTLNNDHGLRTRAGDGPMRVKNLGRFYRCGTRPNYNFGFPTYSLSTGGCNNALGGADSYHFPRVWHEGGLYHHKWGPLASRKGSYNLAAFHSFGPADPTGTEVEIFAGAVQIYQGMRYSLARYSITGALANVRVKVTRNSDWSTLSGPGGTTVHNVTTGPIGTGGPIDFTVGDLLPPQGTFGWVHISIKVTGDASDGYVFGGNILSGARMDIPITCTVVYRDWQNTDHVIPGGYLAGKLTNPPYTPGLLTGAYNYYAAEYNGDGKFVYLAHYGSANTAYTLHSNGFSAGGVQICRGDDAVEEPQSGIGPPGLGPWPFVSGADGVTWFIIDVHGENGTAAQFKVT